MPPPAALRLLPLAPALLTVSVSAAAPSARQDARRVLGPGWTVVAVDSTGDLDHDGSRDLVAVGRARALRSDPSCELGWDRNPLRLVVALRRPGEARWKVVADNAELVPPAASCEQMEPFESVATDSGALVVRLVAEMAMGSWSASSRELRFAWDGRNLVLRRWTLTAFDRRDGSSTSTTLDLQTGSVRRSAEILDNPLPGTDALPADSSWIVPVVAPIPLGAIRDGLDFDPLEPSAR